MSREERLYCLAFSLLEVNAPKFWQIKNYFSSLEESWRAPFSSWEKSKIFPRSLESFWQKKEKLDLSFLKENLETQNWKIITWQEKNFPENLKKIDPAPYLLYYQGDISLTQKPGLAIVGSRKPSFLGKKLTLSFAKNLAPYFNIISGLAFGVDSLAHQTALENNLPTIAVLGSGLENIYPPAHLPLAKKIKEKGLLISEFPPSALPRAYHFPLRNRLIAGLSQAVLIIESSLKSGSLITAHYAREQKKPLFCVPGNPLDKNYAGNNFLLQKKKAKICLCPKDILNHFSLTDSSSPSPAIPSLSSAEKNLLSFVPSQPLSLNKIAQKANLPINQTASLLAQLEIKGVIKNFGQMRYAKI